MQCPPQNPTPLRPLPSSVSPSLHQRATSFPKQKTGAIVPPDIRSSKPTRNENPSSRSRQYWKRVFCKCSPSPPGAHLLPALLAAVPYSDEEDSLMDSFIPTYVYDALKQKKRFDHMQGSHQEDAEEFLGFYLDTLEEELLSISSSWLPKQSHSETQNSHAAHEDGPWLEVIKRSRMAITRMVKSTESPITRMFGGKFRSSLRMPHQEGSILVEDWRSLRSDIQREQIHTRVKDALAYISSPQPVQVTSVTRPGAILDGAH
ncbi:hypothetical protein JVT61DRAFT_14975 [Boletus reticuloceps]|uniref:Peptidase C19 ubiquitin carboxyl-terminal hydrolase domain-containing protein n=1 Tax=Boletus reticuloceps TaxID=495285 RepID=A0A8I2YCI2_9AGAM|nr:hypothetical protein JVT61DRAFT_14975 [Boletus reticuloceps]